MSQFRLVFSLPGSHKFQRFVPHLEGEARFILRPFEGHVTEWVGNLTEDDSDTWQLPLPVADEVECKTKEGYHSMVEKAIRWSEAFRGKVVLSRAFEERLFVDNPRQLLQTLRFAYPNAFVYMLVHPDFGSWIGASPEKLLTRHQSEYQTVALAGTKMSDEQWTDKERKEQQVVQEYIINNLKGEAVSLEGPHEVAFGALRHLQTKLRWKSELAPVVLAERLHPTPAVGGFPFEEALTFIRETETYPRKLYTGYLGFVLPSEDAHLFVNLRCMQLFRDRVRFYVGGGINEWSNPEAEWRETERKIDSTRSIVARA